jgi:hypothetical protein
MMGGGLRRISVMAITQLIYISQRKPDLSDVQLDGIITQSSVRNRSKDVTGVLLMSGRHIMQLLEGNSEVVDELFNRIASDERHSDVRCMLRKEVGKRLYPEWGMKIFDPREDASLDHGRMSRMINDIQAHTNTRDLSVEARVLLNDFRLQLNQH